MSFATETNDGQWLDINLTTPTSANVSDGFFSFAVKANTDLPASGFFVPLHEFPVHNASRMALCKKSSKFWRLLYLLTSSRCLLFIIAVYFCVSVLQRLTD